MEEVTMRIKKLLKISLQIQTMTSQGNQLFSVKLSAPGKVILFGEYSVVFNKPAVAATLCLRTRLNLSETSSDTIHLTFSSLELEKCFSLKDVKECFQVVALDPWDTYLNSLTKALECLYVRTYGTLDLSAGQKHCLITFFHCFWRNLDFNRGFQLKIDSELSVGSGVGSSASFSVVLSAATLLYEYHKKGKELTGELIIRNENGDIVVTDDLKNQISELALSCEKIFHGSPSGVDHNTVLGGSMLEFIKSDVNGNKMTQIETCPIEILLVNTNVLRSTKKLVGSVKQLKEDHPEIIECVLNGMEKVAKKAIGILKDLKSSSNEINKLETRFGDLVVLNHNLLRVLGVSHPSLERIISISNKYNLNAKLTGAGGGGYAFIYLPSHIEVSTIKEVEKELTAEGFTVSEVTLGGPGLIVEELTM